MDVYNATLPETIVSLAPKSASSAVRNGWPRAAE
jgi:hypothetical protein